MPSVWLCRFGPNRWGFFLLRGIVVRELVGVIRVDAAVVTASVAVVSSLAPRQQVGAVSVHTFRELGVEDELPGRVELREVGERSPTHEQIAVARGLGVALRCG